MIGFFRRIRKKFADDNKPMKYMRYAIGEIVLVVLGILIALQINTWNEGRKLMKVETLYLTRLLSENRQDISTFSRFIKELEKGNQAIEFFSMSLKDKTINDTILIHSANEYFKYGSIFPIFSSSNSTFEDLSSTGNLKVITNRKLRDSIVEHYAIHKQVAERIQIAINWALPLDGPFTIENNIMKFEPSTSFLFPEESKEVLAEELRGNKISFISNSAAHYWINNDAISQFQVLSQRTSVLVKHLENELNR